MNVYTQYQQQQQQQPYFDTKTMNNTAVVTAAKNQQSMVWNGSQWVEATSGAGSTVVAAPVVTTGATNKVEMYTSYYHKWHASYLRFTEQKKTDTANPELDNQIQWAKYYAELCSQAAHYFYNNPTAITAPFQLPPAPLSDSEPATTGTTAVASTASAGVTESSQIQGKQVPAPGGSSGASAAASTSSVSSGTGEGALKRYVDRCLSRCQTAEDKGRMIKLIETLISEHLQSNTYHTTSWDAKPVLELNPTPVSTNQHINSNSEPHGKGYPDNTNGINNAPSKFNQQQHYNTNSFSHQSFSNYNASNTGHQQFEPNFNSTNSKYNNNDRKRQMNESPQNNKGTVSCSYYGPSSANDITNDTAGNLYRESKKQKRKGSNFSDNVSLKSNTSSNSNNYYGPSNNGNTNSPSSGSVEDFISLPMTINKNTQQVRSKKKNNGFNNSHNALNDRSKRFGNSGGRNNNVTKNDGVGDFDRFMGKGTIGGGKNLITLDESDYEKMTIKGTCEVLEKDYLRLTAPPRAELVRPQPILQQHLQNLKNLRENFSSGRDYLWFCSQLKAVRQDCTVQRIQNSFAVDVYETHARIALEEDDLNEYNQCQTQLQELYRIHEASVLEDSVDQEKALTNRNEFVAYRIIYHVFLTGNKKYSGGSSDLLKIMVGLTSDQRSDSAIQHALKVREACCNNDLFDYHLFFELYKTCPNLGKDLMKHMVPTVRHKALLRICKGYRPGNVETSFATAELGFDSTEEGCTWLRSCNCVLSDDNNYLITKDCNDIQESMLEEKKSLI